MVLIVFVALFGLLMVSPGAFAYPAIGSNVEFNDSYGSTSGGEFEMWSGSYQYPNTFCVELGEFLDFTNLFKVAAYETPVAETAWLYYHFVKHDLAGYDYGAGRVSSADDLQKAMWFFEGQTGPVANAFTIAASGASAADKAFALTQVVILDLQWATVPANGRYTVGQDAQDVLSVVPEPTTLMLLGLGLIGVAGIRRKS